MFLRKVVISNQDKSIVHKTLDRELIKADYNDAIAKEKRYLENLLIKEKIESDAFWKDHTDKLQLLHATSESSESVLKMRSELMNASIRHFYNQAKVVYKKKYQLEWPEPLCLIALGEYGRNELAPYGTVELMLLYIDLKERNISEWLTHIFHQEVIHALWNRKITVTIVFKRIEDAVAYAKTCLKAKNKLLDARLICGSEDLFHTFQETYKNYRQSEPVDFLINEIIEAKKLRHKKYNTIFLLEPNINLGIGGLKDYQTIFQLAGTKFNNTISLQDLEYYGVFNKSQIKELKEAYNFLTRVRNELQFQNNYDVNLLDKAQQFSIAWALGYNIKDNLACINMFMKDYYKYAYNIHKIGEIVEERLRNYSPIQKKSKLRSFFKYQLRKKQKEDEIDGFIIVDNTLTYFSANIFKEKPIRLIRVFNYLQKYHIKLSIELKMLISDSIYLITEEFVDEEETRQCFCTILQTVGEVYNALQLMHELKILYYLIPEFKTITHLVRHDQYHQYTVDAHILYTIKILDEIFRCKNGELKFYYDVIQTTIEPWLAYLILLLHDLGAYNVKHSFALSLKDAKRILNWLRISQIQQDHIFFAIQNILQMSAFWKKYDVSDPYVVGALGTFIGDIERLNYLYVVNYCDMKGTAKHLWNSYKAALHTKFFENIQKFFSEKKTYKETLIERRKNKYRQLIHNLHPEMSEQTIHKIIALYSDDYFKFNNSQNLEIQIGLLEKLNQAIESNRNHYLPIVHWQDDIAQELTLVKILSRNHKELFTNIIKAFFESELNIVSVNVVAQAKPMIIGTFHVGKQNQKGFLTERSKQIFQQNLNEKLSASLRLKNKI